MTSLTRPLIALALIGAFLSACSVHGRGHVHVPPPHGKAVVVFR
jgi:hypothetical protein